MCIDVSDSASALELNPEVLTLNSGTPCMEGGRRELVIHG